MGVLKSTWLRLLWEENPEYNWYQQTTAPANLAVAAVRTMKEVRSASLAEQRFLMTMLVVFGGVGLLLAVVGV